MAETEVEGCKSSRIKDYLVLALIGASLFGCLVVLWNFNTSKREYERMVIQAAEWSRRITTDPQYEDWVITDDIDTILGALKSYYSDNEYYPPFLYGGQAEFHGGTMAGAKVNPGPNPDPLIAGGYLSEYPKPPSALGDCRTYLYPTDPRSSEHWICAYSTPGDWQAMGDWDPLTPVDENTLAGIPENLSSLQVVTLAGTKGGEFSYWSKELKELYKTTEKDSWFKMCCDFRRDLLYFGYSRGEWFGADEDESWLWFYGSPLWMELGEPLPKTESEVIEILKRRNFDAQELCRIIGRCYAGAVYGLDIIDSASGDLKPDGAEDGIFLLYKLKDGKVVETVLAEE